MYGDGLSTNDTLRQNSAKIADCQGAQARLLKIYQPLKDVLDYLSDSELLDIRIHLHKCYL